MTRALPLPTQDPFARGPLVVTQLQSPTTGTTISGRFTLGWMGRLTPDQLDLVGLLLARRNNLQQLAADLGVAYNTIRSRFDDIVEAVAQEAPVAPVVEPPERPADPARREVLRRLAAGELTPDEALEHLTGRPPA